MTGPRLDAEFLAPLVGSSFDLLPIGSGDATTTPAATTAAAMLTACEPNERGFRLDFAVPGSAEQGMYALRGHGLDDVVFLVPVGRTATGTTLEAIFNHIEGELG